MDGKKQEGAECPLSKMNRRSKTLNRVPALPAL